MCAVKGNILLVRCDTSERAHTLEPRNPSDRATRGPPLTHLLPNLCLRRPRPGDRRRSIQGHQALLKHPSRSPRWNSPRWNQLLSSHQLAECSRSPIPRGHRHPHSPPARQRGEIGLGCLAGVVLQGGRPGYGRKSWRGAVPIRGGGASSLERVQDSRLCPIL